MLSAEKAAFPALLSRLGDDTPAYKNLEDAVVDRKGNIMPPILSGECFQLLQGQIEGVWPKAYRRYYVLTPTNVVNWLDLHSVKPLIELQQIALGEATTKVQAEIDANQNSKLAVDALEFLQERKRNPGTTDDNERVIRSSRFERITRQM